MVAMQPIWQRTCWRTRRKFAAGVTCCKPKVWVALASVFAVCGFFHCSVLGRTFAALPRSGCTLTGESAVGNRWRAVQSLRAAAGETGAKVWSLVVAPTDHYVWRDKNTFVGIVADAGEWTVDLDAVRTAYDEALKTGFATVFSGPLYVIKDYVKELRNYGLVAEARETTAEVGESDGESAGEGEGGWQRRDWKTLPPELKDEAERSRVEADGGKVSVAVVCSDHSVFQNNDAAKFRAYVEMAADAARRWTPEEGELNQFYAKIIGTTGRATVLTGLTAEAAERAVGQLQKSGFTAEAVEEEEEDAAAA